MQDFYRLAEGFEEKADELQERKCKKMILDMHYEAQVQCVINYNAAKLGKKMLKAEVRNYKLTQEQCEEVKFEYILSLI